MAIELPRENRDEGTKRVTSGLLRIVQWFVQIKMEGDELMGTEKFAAKIQGGNCLDVYQR